MTLLQAAGQDPVSSTGLLLRDQQSSGLGGLPRLAAEAEAATPNYSAQLHPHARTSAAAPLPKAPRGRAGTAASWGDAPPASVAVLGRYVGRAKMHDFLTGTRAALAAEVQVTALPEHLSLRDRNVLTNAMGTLCLKSQKRRGG